VSDAERLAQLEEECAQLRRGLRTILQTVRGHRKRHALSRWLLADETLMRIDRIAAGTLWRGGTCQPDIGER
jgi:hypothetical protein